MILNNKMQHIVILNTFEAEGGLFFCFHSLMNEAAVVSMIWLLLHDWISAAEM